MCPCPLRRGGKLVDVSSVWNTSNFSGEVDAEVVGDAIRQPFENAQVDELVELPGRFPSARGCPTRPSQPTPCVVDQCGAVVVDGVDRVRNPDEVEGMARLRLRAEVRAERTTEG